MNLFETEYIKRFSFVESQNSPGRLIFCGAAESGCVSITNHITEYFKNNPTLTDANIFSMYNIIVKIFPNLTFYEISLLIVLAIYTFIVSQQSEGPLDKDLATILQLINNLAVQLAYKSPFSDTQDMMLKFEAWDQLLVRETKRDIQQFQNIQEINALLQNLSPTTTSASTYISTLLSVRVTLDNTALTPERGYEAFNLMQPDYFIPYIQYNDGKRKVFKIFQGIPIYPQPNYSLIVPSFATLSSKHVIYMRVWNHDEPPMEATRLVKASYDNILFYLTDSSLSFEVPLTGERDQNTFLDYISKVIPQLQLDQVDELFISGTFRLYDIKLNTRVFLYLLTNDPVVTTYFYINETKNSFADKKHLKLRLNVGMNEIVSEEDESGMRAGERHTFIILKQEFLEKEEDGFAKSTPYLQVNVNRAVNREAIETIKTLLSYIVSYYATRVDDVEQIYNNFLINFAQFSTTELEEEDKSKYKTNLKELKSKAPDVFVEGYSVACTGKKQPKIIKEHQREEWEKQEITYAGTKEFRTVLDFPPSNPKYYFVCPNDKFPFPSLIENKYDNKEIYPQVPCCASSKSKIMAPTKGTKKQKTKRHITTNKLSLPDEVAQLPRVLRELFGYFIAENKTFEEYEFLRYGTPINPNSFIHAVLSSIDQDYNNLTLDDKIKYAIKIRQEANLYHQALVKQELYDADQHEITSYINGQDIFFDPRLFYRFLEEKYHINIYTFYLNTPEEDSPNIVLELPRYRYFHIRPFIDRPCVLIYKSWGSASNFLKHPHCDLIVARKKKVITKLFAKDGLNEYLYHILVSTQKIYTWTSEPDSGLQVQIVVRQNVYQQLNYMKLFQITAQHIDESGKVRAFRAASEGKHFTIIVPPTQPQNLPLFSFPLPGQDRIDVQTAINLFGAPTGVHYANKEGELDGLWFQILDIVFGVYIPVNKTKGALHIPVGPIPYQQTSLYSRIKKLHQDLNILYQLISWLFLLSKNMPSVQSFVDNYFKIENKGIRTAFDTAKAYDFSYIRHVSQTLPDVQTIEQAINYYADKIPSMFSEDGKIIIYNKNFATKLAEKLKSLHLMIRNNQMERKLVMPKKINGIFSTPDDFTAFAHTLLIMDEKNMHNWVRDLATITENNFQHEIRKTLELADLRSEYPFIYKDYNTNKLYIVQNVIGSDKLRALHVANTWNKYHFNMGFEDSSTQIDITNPQAPIYYVIYSISPTKMLMPTVNKSNGKTDYLQILLFESNRYAALLPIL